jgi:magnesium transporter
VAGTAAGLAERDVPRADASLTAREALDALLRQTYESASDLVVVDEERFVGLVRLEALLAAEPQTPVAALAAGDLTPVPAGADQERTAAVAATLGARSIPVVDEDGRFSGLVPAERLLGVLLREHEEDMARLGGSLAGNSAALQASTEAIPRRLWHRLPWLALGLAGAMVSAAIVASFEDELRAEVLLAFFVPAIVYMADAIGTQTETVVIRGMTLGIPLRAVAVRELLTGLCIGVVVAASFFAFALLVWDDTRVAVIVSLSLLVSTSLATSVAMLLPYLLSRLGYDPAFGSGPLATVVQDILSITAYFTIAVALLP